MVQDPLIGPVRLSGLFDDVPGADTLVLIVHGLGGSAASAYCAAGSRAARRAGFASLRLSLRGADLSGEDLYHGGLVDDLRAALASPEAAAYEHVLLLGYSVGGHIALRAALDQIDPRVRAVAAVCPPLDLGKSADALDAPGRRLYRRAVFAALDRAYTAVAARRVVPIPPALVRRARSCRERDDLTVVTRFGFASAADYYARGSVAPDLSRLTMPGLVLASLHDPIIPAWTLRPALASASAALTVRWIDGGGHVSFPPCLDLGVAGPLGRDAQIIHWLGQHLP
jgi:predicted alpha/beta-fold hydrolase